MPLTDPPTPSAENQRNNKSHCWPLALHLLPTPRQMVDVIILSNSVSRSTSQVFTKLKWRFCFSKWADEMQRDADVSNIIYLVRYDYIHLYFQNRRSIHLRKDVMQVNMLWLTMIWETEILTQHYLEMHTLRKCSHDMAMEGQRLNWDGASTGRLMPHCDFYGSSCWTGHGQINSTADKWWSTKVKHK